jgi:hypothetical protein
LLIIRVIEQPGDLLREQGQLTQASIKCEHRRDEPPKLSKLSPNVSSTPA